MLHACDQRFDVTGNFENFCELNKALVLDLFFQIAIVVFSFIFDNFYLTIDYLCLKNLSHKL